MASSRHGHSGKIRLATRGSALALWQAGRVADLIRARHPGFDVENVIISTRPDRHPTTPLEKMGGDKGLFVKEVEQAVLDGRADAAVHSLKDVPVEDQTPGLCIAAFPERADFADVLLTRDGRGVADLPAGATVATSALRRQAQLLRMRPDLQVCGVRGNVDSRIRKLLSGEFDAIIMAAAGLERLGLTEYIAQRFTPDEFLPAPGQGILAVQTREAGSAVAGSSGRELEEILAGIDDATVRLQAEIERDIARRIGATCHSAAGCVVEVIDGAVCARAVVCAPDGSVRLTTQKTVDRTGVSELAQAVADDLLAQGCGQYL